jgi:5-methylcytosine-specific restriction endonuclease McrA
MTHKTEESKRAAGYKQQLYEKGLCGWCRQPRDSKRGRLCVECQRKNNARLRKKVRKRLEKGLCKACNLPRETGSNLYCRKHWFQKICIDRTGKVKHWQAIADKLDQQNQQCPYSGKPISLGENAQLDHIVPLELGGDNSPENLEWVDAEINRMKGKRTKKDFIELCTLISLRSD